MKTLKKNSTRLIAGATLGVMTLGGMTAMTPLAQAAPKSKTWKKVAIGAAAVTAYGQLKGKRKTRNIGAAATVGSYLMYKRAKKKEARRR